MKTRNLLLTIVLFASIGCGAPASQNPTEQPPSTPIPIPVQSSTTPVSPKEAPTAEPTATTQSTPKPTFAEPAAKPTAEPTPAPVTPTDPPPGSVVVEPSPLANEMSRGLLMAFTHSNPEYIGWVRGAFLHIEDGLFCEAAWKFRILAKEARDYGGERLTSMTYNAGVAYMMFSWDDRNPQGPTHEFSCATSRGGEPSLNLAIRYLTDVSPHLTDDRAIAATNLMLGRAYVNKRAKAANWLNRNVQKDQAEFAEKATHHLCEVLKTGGDREPTAREILAEFGGSC